MIPVRGYKGRKVGILGLGRSGLSAARALIAGGAEVTAWDDDQVPRAAAKAEGLTLGDLSRTGTLEGLAALIVSPGIPHLYPAPHPAITAALAAGVPVDNDIGLFFASLANDDWDQFDSPPRTIAITGSNGKSTTAALIHHILTHAGRAAQLGGNIGRGVLDLDPPGDGEVMVIELSSYQTELARALTPDIAVLTNLTPDHLDRHGGRGGYFAAKRRLFAEGGPDRAVIGLDQPEGRMLAGQLGQGPGDDRVIGVSAVRKLEGPGWRITARKGFLAERRKGRQVAAIDLRGCRGLPGAHNHANACAAYGAVRALGIAPKVIAAAFQSFEGLPHRAQFVAEVGGVVYVNDSKATNAEAAAHALAAFSRVRWIAGGQAKAGGLDGLGAALGTVQKAYLIGEAAREFSAALGQTPSELCGDLETAVARAAAEAGPGETVLLAPAAASFDQFEDFEARGQAFIDAVSKL